MDWETLLGVWGIYLLLIANMALNIRVLQKLK